MEPDSRSAALYYSPADFAALIGVSVRTVRRMYESGRIPCRRIGRLVRIPASALETLWDS